MTSNNIDQFADCSGVMFSETPVLSLSTAAKRQQIQSGLPPRSANASTLQSVQMIGRKGIRFNLVFMVLSL
jgi:outer membrane PBP1 activator LpoA protein